MATALPAENLVERTTPAQDAANKCTQKGATLKCCNSVSQAVANLIPIQVGVQCNNIDQRPGQHWQRLPSSPVDAMSAFLRQSSFTAKSSVLRTWRA
ncbi:MAG: hypothetical protein Q9223_006275 [Gallowayella weberi]